MRRVFGPRTLVEALFLIAVPIVALAAGAGWIAIVGSSAGAYLVVVVLEAALARGTRTVPVSRARAERRPAATAPPGDHVRVLEPEPEPSPEVAQPQPEPEPVAVVPEPEREPEPEPEAPVLPPLAAVPDLPPEPEPVEAAVFEPEPEPEPVAPVVQIAAYGPPRQWNVWDLERLARERSGSDPARAEERTYLLLYLREFADAQGMLPVDFDGLVRESFGELVGAV